MMDATTDLQASVYKALVQDSEILTTLDGAKIFDHVPDRTSPPYIVLGRSTSSDWSTSTETGEAIVFIVHTWSKSASRSENNTLQNLIRKNLDGPIELNDHDLVNLRFQLAETRRDRVTGYLHGVSRFRAITEPKNS